MDLKLKVLSKEVNNLLWNSGLTISTAESCSAGRMAQLLTAHPGSSEYFKGGLVCYADDIKVKFLGVDAKEVEEQQAVSQNIVEGMVKGGNEMFGSTYCVAITGFGGPGGGTPENPVGTIWVAVGTKDRVVSQKVFNQRGRDENVQLAVNAAMALLVDFLKEDRAKN